MAVWRPLSYISAAFCVSTVSSLLSNTGENLVIRHTEEQKPGASKFIVAFTPSYVTFLPEAGAIPSDEISSVIGLALGFSSAKELSWAGLLAGDVFRRPKANVLITIDGVTEDDLFRIPGRVASFPVTETEGASSLGGILSTSSVTQENLPSRVSDVFGGKSLTVSASGSELLAAAGYAAGQNSHTIFWSQAEEQFKQVRSDRAESLKDWHLTKVEILERFEKNDLGADVKFSSSGKVFTMSVPGKGNAVFDMEKKEDFLLFAEVDAILQLLEKLKKSFSNLVEDGVPDIFTLSFSSLKGLRRRYGEKSLQVQGAVEFLKQVIPEIVKKFTDLYNGNVLVEVLTLEWYGDLSAKYPQEMRVVYQEVQPHLLSQSMDVFQDHLPSVALRKDLEGAVKHSLCESVQNKLLSLQSPLRVACGGKHRDRRAVTNPVTAKGAAPNARNVGMEYNEDYPIIFNIWLWLVIVLVLSLYAICVVMWYMDPGRDSIIYRMTSQRIKTD